MLSLSPVPASTTLNVDYYFINDSNSRITLSVFDNIGRQFMNRTFTEDTFTGEINITQLQPGVYYLRLTKDEEVLTKRFTVR
jgi:hypothetical protein